MGRIFSHIHVSWQYLLCGLVSLGADFRLQMLDSAAKIESPEYASLKLKPVSAEFLLLFCFAVVVNDVIKFLLIVLFMVTIVVA